MTTRGTTAIVYPDDGRYANALMESTRPHCMPGSSVALAGFTSGDRPRR